MARWPIIKVRSLNQFRKYWPSYLKWGSLLLIKEFWSIRVNLSLLPVWIFFIVNRKIKNSKRGERNPQLLIKLHSEVTILNILKKKKKTNLRCMCAKARWQWNIFMLYMRCQWYCSIIVFNKSRNGSCFQKVPFLSAHQVFTQLRQTIAFKTFRSGKIFRKMLRILWPYSLVSLQKTAARETTYSSDTRRLN